MDYTVHGILQARILKWVTFPFSRGSSQPRDWTQVSRIAGRFFTSWATREDPVQTRMMILLSLFLAENSWGLHGIPVPLWTLRHSSWLLESESEVTQSCPTLCDPVDCSLPSSSVHGILQARILEWGAISFSRGSSWPRDRTWVSRIGDRCFNLWATREAPWLFTWNQIDSKVMCVKNWTVWDFYPTYKLAR